MVLSFPFPKCIGLSIESTPILVIAWHLPLHFDTGWHLPPQKTTLPTQISHPAGMNSWRETQEKIIEVKHLSLEVVNLLYLMTLPAMMFSLVSHKLWRFSTKTMKGCLMGPNIETDKALETICQVHGKKHCYKSFLTFWNETNCSSGWNDTVVRCTTLNKFMKYPWRKAILETFWGSFYLYFARIINDFFPLKGRRAVFTLLFYF